MSVTIQLGDSRALLASLDADSVDSCVTDPPYELGFMGRAWDSTGVAYDVELWREVFRVLKPGAHLAAFGGTRTFHRMAVAIEDAGFEIRDQLAWAYGSGFPKSLDVAKAIAKQRHDRADVRHVCRFIRAAMDRGGLKSRHLIEHFGNCDPRLVDHWAARDSDSQPSLPTNDQFAILKSVLDLGPEMDAEVLRLNARKGEFGEQYKEAEVVGEYARDAGGLGGERFNGKDGLIRDVGGEWKGWGTALKPAWEPICLARKPLIGTVAANVLAHGTGGLNVDACRIPGAKPDTTRGAGGQNGRYRPLEAQGRILDDGRGRFPANIVHDGSDEVLAGFPDSNGGGNISGNEPSDPLQDVFSSGLRRQPWQSHSDTGSAARFFYSAKAGKLDRLGSDHPTVKPVDLMRWLVRLITPPGGTLLDPFAGSGSTGVAAHIEGFDAILMELRPEAVADIERRLAYIKGEGRTTAIEAAKLKSPKAARKARGGDTPLFAEPE